MPNPRNRWRSRQADRRLARDLATRDALTALATLAPSAAIPEHAMPAYRLQLARCSRWIARAGGLDLSRSDTAGARPEGDGSTGA